MKLEIVTPDKHLFNGEIKYVALPGKMGRFKIMPFHAAMISTLKDGELKFMTIDLNEVAIQIPGGICEVKNNQVIVCIDGL